MEIASCGWTLEFGRKLEGMFTNKTVLKTCRHTKISTQTSKLVVSCQSLYASPEDGDA